MTSDFIDNWINELNQKLELLTRRLEHVERNSMKQIVRKLLVPPTLQKIQLHQQTPQYHVDLFAYLPLDQFVKAVLVTVTVIHSNHPFGHAYLGFNAYQQRGAEDQKTTFYEQTYNCHGTQHQQELIVPWNNATPNSLPNLVIDITSSYNTGTYDNHGNVNYFQIKVTGYIV